MRQVISWSNNSLRSIPNVADRLPGDQQYCQEAMRFLVDFYFVIIGYEKDKQLAERSPAIAAVMKHPDIHIIVPFVSHKKKCIEHIEVQVSWWHQSIKLEYSFPENGRSGPNSLFKVWFEEGEKLPKAESYIYSREEA